MTKYRVVRYHRKGYYTYYRVQRRFLLFFWGDDSKAFDHLHQAKHWIAEQANKDTQQVVHEE